LELATKEAAEKKKQVIKKKVLGDDSRIKAKVFDPRADIQEEVTVPIALAGITSLGSTTKSI